MSILIKGMKMPKDCESCTVAHLAECELWMAAGYKQRHKDCPLVHVHTPHGRLIDANQLLEAMYHRAFEEDGDTMWKSGCWVRYRAIEKVQDAMPTIIEAEEGAEE